MDKNPAAITIIPANQDIPFKIIALPCLNSVFALSRPPANKLFKQNLMDVLKLDQFLPRQHK